MRTGKLRNETNGARSPKIRRWLAVPIALALLASACGSSAESVATSTEVEDVAESVVDSQSEGSPDPDPDPDSTEEVIDDGGGPIDIDIELLTAGTWTLMFGGGPDGEVPLVEGYPITITFDGDGSFGGTAACNGYGGTYGVDGPQIFLSEFDTTEMGCASDIQASERAFVAALADSIDVNITPEQLALSGPSSELIFVPGEVASLEPLWGESFALESILIDGEPQQVALDDEIGDPVILAIHPDDSFTATTGCRTLEGQLVVSGSEVVVTESIAEGECTAEYSARDNSIVSILADGFTFEYDGGQLLISSGNEALQYRNNTLDAVIDAPDAVEGDSN